MCENPEKVVFGPKNSLGGYNCSVELIRDETGYRAYLKAAPGKNGGGDESHFQDLMGVENEKDFPVWIREVKIQNGKEKYEIEFLERIPGLSFPNNMRVLEFEEVIAFMSQAIGFKRLA